MVTVHISMWIVLLTFILNELSNNVDGFRLSTYMHKRKVTNYIWGLFGTSTAFGNADYCDGGAHDVWAYRFNERCGSDGWSIPFGGKD